MPTSFKCDQTLCRNTYYNYGSYLRSRGYDKEICNLIMELQNGHIPISALKVNTDTGVLQINGAVQINGNLTVTGDTALEGPNTRCETLNVKKQLLNPGIQPIGSETGNAIINESAEYRKSSERYKSEIAPLGMLQSKSILQIEPKTFEYNDKPGTTRVGVIAEELDAVGLKEYVEYSDKGEPDGVHYQTLVAPLIQLVKDLTERVENLEVASALLLKNLE